MAITFPNKTGIFEGSSNTTLFVMPSTANLTQALSQAAANATATNPYVLRLTTAVYTISSTLDIPSYTTLDLNGSILKGDATSIVSIMQNSGYDTLAANTDITIKNGTIDWNGANRGNPADPLDNMGVRFTQTDLLTFQNLRFLDADKYAALIHRCDDFTADNIYFNTNSDGLHFSNGGKRHSINNVYGVCGDDLVAYTMTDWGAYEIDTYIEDFSSIYVSNLRPNDTERAVVKFIGGMSNDAYTNTGITDNLDGTYTVAAANHNFVAGDYVRILGATSATYNDVWLVDSVVADTSWTFTRATGLGNSTVHGTSQLQRYFDNVVVDGMFGTCLNYPIKLGEDTSDASPQPNDINYTHYKSIVFRNIKMDSYTNSLIQVLCDDSVIFDNLTVDIGGDVNLSGTNYFVQYSGTGVANTEIENFFVSNVRFLGTAQGTGKGIQTEGSCGTLMLNNVVVDTASLLISQTNGTWVGTTIQANNWFVKNSNTGIQVRDTLSVHLSNTRHTGNLNRLIINQHADAALSVYGSCMDVGTDNRTVEQATNGTVHIYGDIRAQAADVTAAAGVFFFDVTAGEYTAYDGAANSVIN